METFTDFERFNISEINMILLFCFFILGLAER